MNAAANGKEPDMRSQAAVRAALLVVLGGAILAAEEGNWQVLFANEAWYKNQPTQEQVFAGTLQAIPETGGASTLMRTSYYRLGARNVYTGAKKVAVLDALVGKAVEMKGKPWDMNLEGQAVSEIWPAAVRLAPGAASRPTSRPTSRKAS